MAIVSIGTVSTWLVLTSEQAFSLIDTVIPSIISRMSLTSIQEEIVRLSSAERDVD
jgi:hypothetical protein